MEIKSLHTNSNLSSYSQMLNMYPPSNKTSRTKKSPNSPLIKSPFIKLKIEAKNLEKALINNTEINEIKQINNSNINSTFKEKISLEPYANIKLNSQNIKTKSIYHNSPKWLEEYELEIKNNKIDKIEIEIYTKIINIENNRNNKNEINIINKDKFNSDPIFLGFQIIPIKFLEKFEKVGESSQIWLRLINKKQDEYFVKESKHVLNIENHDANNYKVDENLIKNEKDVGVPLIKIQYEYMNFYNLWLINCSVHSIIQREDIFNKNKVYYVYKLFIRRNDGMEWFKDTTYEEIEKFRNYIIKYINNIANLPFPTKSVFSYLPFISRFYSDENNDVLIEKKFILDNFFEQILINDQVYKLDDFNLFFGEDNI